MGFGRSEVDITFPESEVIHWAKCASVESPAEMGTHRRSLTWDDWDDPRQTKLAAFIMHLFNQTMQLNGTENTNLQWQNPWQNPWENSWKLHGNSMGQIRNRLT